MRFSKAATILSGGLPLIQAAVPEIQDFKLTWSDDFDGAANSLPSSKNWIIDTGTSYPGGPPNWGTGEVQTYTKSLDNIHLSGDGVLNIIPLRNSSGGWTSARIETTRTDFGALPLGKMRIQANISMPDVTGDRAAGYWPAFWTLGGAFRGKYDNWPGVGELDIMENVNGVDLVWSVMHCGTNPDGPCNEPGGLGANSSCPGSSCQGNWHTYTLEIDRTNVPEALRWYVDGQVYHYIEQDHVGYETWAHAVHSGHFALLNVAMGGEFANGVFGDKTPTKSTAPGIPMAVDYVAVYNSWPLLQGHDG